MPRKWTKPQNDAITARGGSVLVSAAAGSGKTAVLVERAVSLICDAKNPVDADRLLIVTFSNAAAAEMKQRMSHRLSEMIRENPQDLFLQRQKTLLASAQISTIHSFCLELLRSNFQNLDISPDFSIADENELAVMKSDCVNACIERFYQADKSGGLAELVELLAAGRDDTRLAQTIIKIYDFSRSHPFFEDWLDEKLAMYDTELPVGKTAWGTSILRYATDSLRFCYSSLNLANELAADGDKMQKAYGEALRSDISQLKDCLEAAERSDWSETVQLLASFEFIPLKPLRGDDPVKERIKNIRTRSRKICKTLAEKYLNASEDDFKSDIGDLRPKITLLFALVKEFASEFAMAKSEKYRLDFSDFEHLALKLLVQKTPGGYTRTEQAREIAARFDHVLVDEYQDTNEVQDLIFTSISREQENLFMVGDVKQSIYAFRQAMPEIFMAKRQKFFPYDTGFFPAKINLDTNFRSRREVTCAVNFLFERLMSETVGEIDYNEEESLKCGAVYAACSDSAAARPALMLVSTAGYDGERNAAALEAAVIAEQIASMLESGYMVAEGAISAEGAGSENLRVATPRDFCILLRAPKNRAEVYVRELTARGVPAWAESSGGYLTAREVSSVVCMLKAVDNPLLDIELAAAMLSPFFDFTDDDIAVIRLKARKVPFYTALSLAAETDGKAAAFLKVFMELRAKSAILPADRLIMRFYEIVGAMAVVRAMPMGDSRAANLQLLAEYAAEYHSLGYKQLGGFIAFLKRLEEKDRDLAPANTMGGGANVVRIMSVHHSKGLEFPVVFLADSAKKFNKTDLYSQTMLHSKFGFACIRRDNTVFKQFPTVPMQSIRLESERSMLSEELRILYVALTRAREKLIITTTVKSDLQKKLTGLCGELERGKLASYAVGEASSYADWILAALLHHKSAASLREAAGIDGLELIDDGNDWEIILREPVSAVESAISESFEPVAKPDEELLSELKRRVSYKYPYEAETKIPAKLAVSSVSKAESAAMHRFSARPKFMTAEALTAAEKGNAMHKFMQFANYENARNRLEYEIGRMDRERFLSRSEIESLDRQRLRQFFKSNLSARIFAAEKVYRELKFMAECGQDILKDMELGGAEIVLQGVADCVFIENNEAVIVDYKTDRVKTADELLGRYESQLSYYRAILGESLGVPVKQCVLYSFALSAEVIV